MNVELELASSTCSSSYSFMDPAYTPIGSPGPIPDTNSPLPLATDILVSQPPIRSEFKFHVDTTATRNPENIKWDLEKTQTVDFTTMMKMFLIRNRINVSTRADIEGLVTRVPILMKEADAEYRELLEQAIDLCNLDILSSQDKNQQLKLCKYVKQQVRAFCNATVETDRYLPIVNLLNAILGIDDENEAIFIRNDPMFVESSHLPSSVTKRKPDVVLVELEACKRWLGLEVSGTSQQCMEAVSEVKSKGKGKGKKKGKGKAEVKQQERRGWIPIAQFWEFKMRKKLTDLLQRLKSPFEMTSLIPSASGAPEEVPTSLPPVPESSSMATKRQHSGDLQNPGPTKKARKTRIGPGGRIMPPPPSIPELDDYVQCAYYAIELLRVSWKASHASGILLKDELLEVLWYDPQGCIRTTPIDIVSQLPLLIVLVRAQRRSKYLSGLRKTPIPGNFDLINQATPRFQLVGRMSSWGKLKASTTPITSTQISDEDGATHFFKSSWPEDSRPREHTIINTAITRANTHLPNRFRPFILNHLPTVSVSEEIYDTSTAIIRTLLGLSTIGARTQYLMCSNLLSNLLGVAHVTVFKVILRDVVRAHRLLWVIGIAHGDVSFHNIMIKSNTTTTVGVLNDFDLASVMEPGASSPPKIGSHRTGTPLFMSVDLLTDEALRAGVPRLYRHDLESFAWVLLYASVCVADGKENLDVEPFRNWISIGPSQLREKKYMFLQMSKQIRDLPNKECLIRTFGIWFRIIIVLGYEGKVPGPEGDTEILGEVLRAWKIAKEEWEDFALS